MSTTSIGATQRISPWNVEASRLHTAAQAKTNPELIVVDPRAREAIKATTGITLGECMEVVDNPTGKMPPWDVIQEINRTFTEAPRGTDVTPAMVSAAMAKYSDHFTPLASYDPSTLVGVWDLFKDKDATIDVRL